MYNKKSLAIIFFFLGLSYIIGFFSITSSSNILNQTEMKKMKNVEKSEFINVQYFKAFDNKPSFELKSSELIILGQVMLNFEKPNGTLFSEGRQIVYQANKGHMHQIKRHLNLFGDVELEDRDSKYFSNSLTYNGLKDELFANGNVKSQIVDPNTKDKITLNSDELTSILKTKTLILGGGVKGKIQRKRGYEGNLNFKAESVEVNSMESLIKLSNYVEIRRNNYYLTAGNAEIFLENFNKKLKYYSLYDDVKLEENIVLPSGRKQLRRAFAEKLEAHQRAGKVILTGAPRVEQGDDIIKGYQITLRENVELVEVDDAKSSFNLKRDKND